MSLLDLIRSPESRVPRTRAGRAEVVDLADPAEVVVPLEYPGRVLFSPLVAVGDTVSRYQVIGRSEQGNCVHASIGGVVTEIRTIWTATSYHVPAVVIARGDAPVITPQEALAQHEIEVAHVSRPQLFRACGIMSPWTTPGVSQVEADVEHDILDLRHLVLVGHDQEPTIRVNERLLAAYGEQIHHSLGRLRDLTPRATIYLTVPRRLADWARSQFGDDLTVVPVDPAYPKRLLRLLIPRITGLAIPHAAPYRHHGVAVLTVEEVVNILGAAEGRPVTHTTVTMAGADVPEPVTMRVPVGTRISDIIASQSLDPTSYARVVVGGPMSGSAVVDMATPVDRFSQGVFLAREDQLPVERNLTCIHCGRCTRACPSRLQVHLMGRAVEFNQFEAAVDMHPEACIECGLCAFVCPSLRPLLQMVRIAKRYGGQRA